MDNPEDRRQQQNKYSAHGVVAGLFLGSAVFMGTVLLVSIRWVEVARYRLRPRGLELQGQMVETVEEAVARVRGMTYRTMT